MAASAGKESRSPPGRDCEARIRGRRRRPTPPVARRPRSGRPDGRRGSSWRGRSPRRRRPEAMPTLPAASGRVAEERGDLPEIPRWVGELLDHRSGPERRDGNDADEQRPGVAPSTASRRCAPKRPALRPAPRRPPGGCEMGLDEIGADQERQDQRPPEPAAASAARNSMRSRGSASSDGFHGIDGTRQDGSPPSRGRSCRRYPGGDLARPAAHQQDDPRARSRR